MKTRIKKSEESAQLKRTTIFETVRAADLV